MIILNKYPVMYQGEEYEVRWEASDLYKYVSELDIRSEDIKLVLYKVEDRQGITRFLGDKKYREVHYIWKDSIPMAAVLIGMIEHTEDFIVDEDLFITEATVLIMDYDRELNKIKQELNLDQKQKERLAQWDGIINI